MELDLKNCLFVGVDIQRQFTRCAPAPMETLERIRALREQISAHGVPSVQAQMLPDKPIPSYFSDVATEREQLRRDRDYALLCEPLAGERVFHKRTQTASQLGDYVRYSRPLPKAVFVYGYFLEACVRGTALQIARQLPSSTPVAIIADCGQKSTQNVELDKVCGERVALLSRDQLQFKGEQLQFPDPIIVPRPAFAAASARFKSLHR